MMDLIGDLRGIIPATVLPLTADVPDARVWGRVMVYDPIQNVTLLLGGVPDNPYMFLFRYSEAR